MERVMALLAAVLVAVGFGSRQSPPLFRSSPNGIGMNPQPSMVVAVGEHAPPTVPLLQASQLADTSLETRYLGLVDRYRGGDAGAIAEILVWKDAQIRAAIAAMSRLVVRGRPLSGAPPPGEITARAKAAAIMLHTDAGLREIVALRKPESFHLKVAHLLMLESEASPFGAVDSTLDDFNVRNWVIAVVELLVDRMEYEPARSVLGPGGPRVAYRALLEGTDRDLVLAAGWTEESAAFFGERVVTNNAKTASVRSELETSAFMTRSQDSATERMRVKETRERAERLYRRVLQLDAGCDEARLRLGRVLLDEGQLSEAADHLGRVLAGNGEPRRQCLAALFLGALREKEGKIDAAVGLYSDAVAADPRSQAARVALSAALALAGKLAQARDAVGPLATRRAPDSRYTDPWSAYVLGKADADRLSRLRQLVMAQ